MAEIRTPQAQYLAGEDPEFAVANKRYQDALARLSESLSNRKQLFDPIFLAMAQGFGMPTQTGGFGESLGNAAGKMGAAQELENKRQQELNAQEVAVAGQGIELQRMKARDADIMKFLSGGASPARPITGPQTAAIVGPQAGPLSGGTKPPEVVSEPPAGGLSQASTATSDQPPPKGALSVAEVPNGIQIMPGNPAYMTQKEYVALNRSDRSKSLPDLLAKGAEIEMHRNAKTEGGTTDYRTGIFYPTATGKYVDIPIMGEGYSGTYTIPETVSMQLTYLANQGNFEGYKALADKFTGRSFGSQNNNGAPTAAPQLSTSERTIQLEGDKTRAVEINKVAGSKEANLEETDATARRIFGSVTRVADYLKQSPDYFGIFARPGIIPAIGNLITQGIQTPNGTLNLSGFEDSMRRLMPGVMQRDLDNVTKAGTELAEIELAFTRMYLYKQGAVTEGERKIVRAIPGTTSSSPEVLKTRMELLKARSQFDIDVVDAFRQWQDKNRGRSYFEFERKSDLYKEIKKGFEAETEKIFGGIKAVPTNQRRQEPGAGQPSPGFVRGVDGVIRRKKAGE